MKDATISLVRGNPTLPGYEGIVNRAIMDVEKGWAVHVRVYVRGYTFEETLEFLPGKVFPFSGVKQTLGVVPADLFREPIMDWTPQEVEDLWTFCKVQTWIGRGYNIPQLLADAVIFKTRPFWEWLNYVPFAAHHRSAVCSAFVGEGLVGAGKNYFPNIDPAMLTPQDFVTMDGYQDVAA